MILTHMLHKDSSVRRAVGLLFFLLPIEYVAEILSVAAHEILGHGLSAVLLGGTFSGFVLKWDAMGWAFCDLPSAAPLAHQILFLASGVTAEMSCGLMLLGLSLLLRKRPDIQLALFVASSTCLIAGSSYVLWNAYHPFPVGDIGRIIWLSCGEQAPEVSVVRWTLLISGGLFFAGTVLYFYIAVFVRVEALILRGGQLAGGARLLALLVFLVLPDSIGWLMFDWNQLAPGIGFLPNVTGILSVVLVAALLFWHRPRLNPGNHIRLITWRHVVVSCMCLTATVIVLVLWLQDGVKWG